MSVYVIVSIGDVYDKMDLSVWMYKNAGWHAWSACVQLFCDLQLHRLPCIWWSRVSSIQAHRAWLSYVINGKINNILLSVIELKRRKEISVYWHCTLYFSNYHICINQRSVLFVFVVLCHHWRNVYRRQHNRLHDFHHPQLFQESRDWQTWLDLLTVSQFNIPFRTDNI